MYTAKLAAAPTCGSTCSSVFLLGYTVHSYYSKLHVSFGERKHPAGFLDLWEPVCYNNCGSVVFCVVRDYSYSPKQWLGWQDCNYSSSSSLRLCSTSQKQGMWETSNLQLFWHQPIKWKRSSCSLSVMYEYSFYDIRKPVYYPKERNRLRSTLRTVKEHWAILVSH